MKYEQRKEKASIQHHARLVELGSKLKVSQDVIVKAIEIFYEIQTGEHNKGVPTEEILVASLYISSHIVEGQAFPAGILFSRTGITKNRALDTSKTMCRKLKLNLAPSEPKHFVNFIKKHTTNFSEENIALAVELSDICRSRSVKSTTPVTTLASMLYVVAVSEDLPHTQRSIADIFGLTEVSIRNGIHEGLRLMKDRLGDLPEQLKARRIKYAYGKIIGVIDTTRKCPNCTKVNGLVMGGSESVICTACGYFENAMGEKGNINDKRPPEMPKEGVVAD